MIKEFLDCLFTVAIDFAQKDTKLALGLAFTLGHLVTRVLEEKRKERAQYSI